MSETEQQPVLFETLPAGNGYSVAVATLNAPKSINALSMPMVELLMPQLQRWQDDSSIACVLLRGSGDKGFCAGGDVLQLRESALQGDDRAAHFFEEEYRLDYLIHTYRKPVVVWGHGVVMGGGLGLFAGASHRVVTAQTRLAMPEVSIGLFPDVGGTWFLNRTPGRTGFFLALTGASINASDTLFLGLADRFLDHAQWSEVVSGLTQMPWGEPDRHAGQVSQVLRELEAKAGERPPAVVRDHYDWIQQITDADSLDEIVARITRYEGDDVWLQRAAQTLATGCPVTIRIIDEQFRRGLHLSLKEAFQVELIVSIQCMRHGNFAEGVRALLVDKDRKPRFAPARLDEVTPALVDEHFASPWGDRPNPLDNL